MREQQPYETPEAQLLALEHFMDVTAKAVAEQSKLIGNARGFLGPERHQEYDSRLQAEINANLETASAFIGQLASAGITLTVRTRNENRHMLQGIGLEPRAGYSVGIIGDNGETQLIPLDDTNQLEIARYHVSYPRK